MLEYWTAHLQTDDEKKRFINQMYGAREVFERLYTLIAQKEKELGMAERSKDAYENPNWAYLQAHRNGCAQQLNAIKKLVTLDHQKI